MAATVPRTYGVFLKGLHQYTFRSGKSALVTGLKYTDAKEGKRLCYEITFPDGFTDLVPLCEVNGTIYELRSEP